MNIYLCLYDNHLVCSYMKNTSICSTFIFMKFVNVGLNKSTCVPDIVKMCSWKICCVKWEGLNSIFISPGWSWKLDFSLLFPVTAGAILWQSVVIGGGSQREPPNLGRKTDKSIKMEVKCTCHLQDSNSQPQCWLVMQWFDYIYLDCSVTEAPLSLMINQ